MPGCERMTKGRERNVERSEIQDKVCSILAEQLAVDAGKVTPEARFSEDLDADSLDLVEAVLALEEEFGVSIPEEEMEDVATVGQAVDLIVEKLGASA
jgi:acyl carrier protein